MRPGLRGKRYAYRACVVDSTSQFLTSENGNAIAKAPHYIFVSSASFNGNLNGLVGGNAKCAAAAANAGLPTATWKALLSDSNTHVKNRISLSGSLYNLKGEVIATSNASLWDGGISHDIRTNEFGSDVGNVDIWTGSNSDGTRSSDTCSSWSSSSSNGASGRYGDAQQNDADWVSDGSENCNNQNRLYCISQ